MYDEAQEKFKGLKEEERFLFKVVKSKKRKPKQEPAAAPVKNPSSSSAMLGKLFDVKKYIVPKSMSSNKELPSSSESSSEDGH